MLQISIFEEPYSVKLRLEGKLNSQTSPLLTRRWAEVRNRTKGMDRKLILDLGDVVELDEAGRQLLRWLAASGFRFSAVHPALRSEIEELICAPAMPRPARRTFPLRCKPYCVYSDAINRSLGLQPYAA